VGLGQGHGADTRLRRDAPPVRDPRRGGDSRLDPGGIRRRATLLAVWGIYENTRGWSGVTTGYETIFQDARAWDEQGIFDVLAPMVYWTIKPTYGERLDFAYLADEHAAAVHTSLLVGMYVPGMDGASLARHVERARIAGAEGVSVFSYSALNDAALWAPLKNWGFHWAAGALRGDLAHVRKESGSGASWKACASPDHHPTSGYVHPPCHAWLPRVVPRSETHPQQGRRPMRPRPTTIFAIVLCAALGCGDGDPVRLVDGDLAVVVEESGLRLFNEDFIHPMGVVATEKGTAALVDLAPCDAWDTVNPRASRFVPFETILGWSEGASEVIVYWCTQSDVPRSGSVAVRLRR